MAKLKITWRVWILIIAVALSILAIQPTFQEGLIIKSVKANSTAFDAGLRQGQKIISVDSMLIKTNEEYTNLLTNKFPSIEKVKTVFKTDQGEFILYSNTTPEIALADIPKTALKTGLDLQGGARALVRAQNASLSSNEIGDLVAVTENRLNIYGISDVQVRTASDLEGNNFMLIEVAGATPEDLEELISQQGKFEAKIGDNIAFIGGQRDITSVCRNDATCAGIESCNPAEDRSVVCRFYFVIYLSEEAAKRHADITRNLSVNISQQGRYLSKPLELYLDDQLVDTLLISEDLKGRETTQIQIQGSGQGATQDEAIKDAEASMQKLQTILITGSLPYKLEIVKLDTISPRLGATFTRSIIIAGFAALIAVAIVILIRYRKIKPSLLLLATSISEVVIILGVAALIDWNLDLPSIAGILATIGTGIDQQIIILDETRYNQALSLKERFKRALAIIFGTFLTACASLLPLMTAGAGLLKGFAITTIIGITAGILITRPAFADLIKDMQE